MIYFWGELTQLDFGFYGSGDDTVLQLGFNAKPINLKFTVSICKTFIDLVRSDSNNGNKVTLWKLNV